MDLVELEDTVLDSFVNSKWFVDNENNVDRIFFSKRSISFFLPSANEFSVSFVAIIQL